MNSATFIAGWHGAGWLVGAFEGRRVRTIIPTAWKGGLPTGGSYEETASSKTTPMEAAMTAGLPCLCNGEVAEPVLYFRYAW
eukprot:1839737-Pleurochrysis_carterae.AAC.1